MTRMGKVINLLRIHQSIQGSGNKYNPPPFLTTHYSPLLDSEPFCYPLTLFIFASFAVSAVNDSFSETECKLHIN